MKNSFFQLLSFLILFVSLVSCSKEHAITESTNLIDRSDHDAYLKQLEKDILASGKQYRIEAATLEELNAALRAAGMDEISEEEVEIVKSIVHPRTTYPCALWVALGDVDGNSTLNVNDIVVVRNWMCDYGMGGCYGDATSIYSCSPCPPDSLTDYAWLSGLGYDTKWDTLGNSDNDAAKYRILGLIPCN